MPRSKTFSPDVNVWLALASSAHVHHPAAARWFDSLGDEAAVFCRVTQMGLLRLLTNPRVMSEDAVSPADAWKVYHKLAGDVRVCFSAEPPGLEQAWQACMQRSQAAQNLWTDAYLQAFARLREFSIVTFDRGFRRFADPGTLILA